MKHIGTTVMSYFFPRDYEGIGQKEEYDKTQGLFGEVRSGQRQISKQNVTV